MTTYITYNSKEMYSKERERQRETETERQRQTHTHRDTEREDSHIIVHHLNIKPFDDWLKPKFSYYKSTAHTCTVNCAALHLGSPTKSKNVFFTILPGVCNFI